MVSTVGRIKKRDGTIADFNQDKITNAIFKAMQSEGVKDKAVGITTSMFWASTLRGADNAALVQSYPQAYKDDAGDPAPATAARTIAET